jgi:hypothetical protein
MGPSVKDPSNTLAKGFCEKVLPFSKIMIPVVGEMSVGHMDFSRRVVSSGAVGSRKSPAGGVLFLARRVMNRELGQQTG